MKRRQRNAANQQTHQSPAISSHLPHSLTLSLRPLRQLFIVLNYSSSCLRAGDRRQIIHRFLGPPIICRGSSLHQGLPHLSFVSHLVHSVGAHHRQRDEERDELTLGIPSLVKDMPCNAIKRYSCRQTRISLQTAYIETEQAGMLRSVRINLVLSLDGCIGRLCKGLETLAAAISSVQ